MDYPGNDNYGHPKSEYLSAIALMSEDELAKEVGMKIWLSSYAANNPRSDYHWQCDACYSECVSRGKIQIYEREYKMIEKSL